MVRQLVTMLFAFGLAACGPQMSGAEPTPIVPVTTLPSMQPPVFVPPTGPGDFDGNINQPDGVVVTRAPGGTSSDAENSLRAGSTGGRTIYLERNGGDFYAGSDN